MVWSTMSANGSLTATGVLLWCPPQRTLDKAFSWKTRRHRESKCGVYFVHRNTVAKINATVSWRSISRGKSYRNAPLSPGITPERVAGISDVVLHSLNARNILLIALSLPKKASLCLRVSSEAGGESLRNASRRRRAMPATIQLPE